MLPLKIRQQTSAWAEHRFSLRSCMAFTCQAAQDNPDQADAAVTFSPVKSGITVTAGQTATVDLP